MPTNFKLLYFCSNNQFWYRYSLTIVGTVTIFPRGPVPGKKKITDPDPVESIGSFRVHNTELDFHHTYFL
jgi:hypothetical protein